MAQYSKRDAREWAREHLRGVANVIPPSFTTDLSTVNEAGIRHDVRKNIEYGFAGALLVSEVSITLDEYRQFTEWAVDEAKGRQKLIHHASFNTFDQNITAVGNAEQAGAELVLLSYPPNFYPETPQDIYDYTKAFCDKTNLGVMLFPVPLWGFGRLHPADIETALIRRLLDDCPNIVAIKAEGAMPSIMHYIECQRLFGKEVVVNAPLECDMIPLAQVTPMQFSGTSNTEYFGPTIPHVFNLIQRGEFDEATRLFWQIHPGRQANSAANAYMTQTHFINRMIWKFQGWLTGYNGGPLRQPTMRIHESVMNSLRQGLIRSQVAVTEDPNGAFFTGRNPTEFSAQWRAA